MWIESAGGGFWIDYLLPYTQDSGPTNGNPAFCGPTNYVCNAGFYGVGNGYDQMAGPYQRNSQTRLLSITDGTSNTLGFGEYCGVTSGPQDFAFLWMGAGCMATFTGAPANGGDFSFGSKHTGIVNFAFCDGSVHAMTISGLNTALTSTPTGMPSYPYTVLMAISGMSDGVVVNMSAAGN
jgi:prepilin-type processing-associated H-X9-DG protein